MLEITPPDKYKPMAVLLKVLSQHMAAEQYQAAATVVNEVIKEFDSLKVIEQNANQNIVTEEDVSDGKVKRKK